MLLILLAFAPVAVAEGERPEPANDDRNRVPFSWDGPDPPPGSPCRPHCALG